MPLIPLEPHSALDQIFDIAKGDPQAAEMACRLVLFDAWDDCLAVDGARAERVVAKALQIGHDRARRALVRTAVQSRLQGGDLDDVLKAAAHLTLLEDVAKDDPDDYHGKEPGERDAKGRFARLVDAVKPYAEGGANGRLAQDLRMATDESSGTDRAAYRRLALTGRAMTAAGVATGSPTLAATGTVAQLSGNLGPEAERVLGPGVRRLGYRYRGSERRPDRGLQTEMTSVSEEQVEALQADPALLQRVDPRSGNVQASLVSRAGQLPSMSTEEATGRVRADLAMAHYLVSPGGVPTPERTRLSIAAGQLPPSRGVIIDADGDLVTDAVGFHGDHYLPFDLANLRRLQGGQYVRTRAAGGPTTEDIYTGLLSGARQVGVVSNSGAFVLEFDPDLRGGRRYSDKAHAMVRRYGQLLEAVRSAEDKGLYAQDIPQAEKNRLRAEAMEQTGYDKTLADEVYNENIKRERLKASLAGGEAVMEAEVETRLDAAVEDANNRGQRLSTQAMARLRGDITREVVAEHRDDRVRPFRLDGEGYAAALNSLAEEFPQFIRSVEYRTLPQFEQDMGVRPREALRRGRGGTDQGYVAPGQLTAAGSRSESYAPAPRGGQKTTADTAGTTAGARKPAAAAASGAGARPATTAPPPLVRGARPRPGTVDLAQEFATARRGVRLQAVSAMDDVDAAVQGMGKGEPVLGKDVDDSEARQVSADMPARYLQWIIQAKGGGTSSGAVDYLMQPGQESRLHREKVEAALEKVVKDVPNYPGLPVTEERLARATEMLSKIDAVMEPFAQPSGDDWVLQEPDLDAPKPLALPEVTSLGAVKENYDDVDRAIEAEQSVFAAKARQFKSMTDKEIASAIRKEIGLFKMLQEWGATGVQPVGAPDSLASAARSIASQGPEKSLKYSEIRAAQQAWAYKKARKVAEDVRDVNAVTGFGGGGAPPLAQPPEPGVTAKRHQPARVVRVHPPGSALAQAFQEFRKQVGI